MSTQVLAVKKEELSPAIEKALMDGDLSGLTVQERVKYYYMSCDSLGLNPLTKPFQYITMNGKLTLYTTKGCTDQLRQIHKISTAIKETKIVGDIFLVIASSTAKDGRFDESTGAVNIKGLYGDNLANAYLKAETKAKRRGTLSICGLNYPDESEIDSIPGAQRVTEDYKPKTIEAIEQPKPQAQTTLSYDSKNKAHGDALVCLIEERKLDEMKFEEMNSYLHGVEYNLQAIEAALKKGGFIIA